MIFSLKKKKKSLEQQATDRVEIHPTENFTAADYRIFIV